MDVEYRGLAQFPGYRFGSDGSIWSSKQSWRADEWTLRKQTKRFAAPNSKAPYFYIGLSTKTKVVLRSVHSLICEAFHGSRPDGMQCRHLDGNGLNNRSDNLTWGTAKENRADAIRHGTHLSGSRCPWSKFDEATVSKIRAEIAAGAKIGVLAKKYGVRDYAIRSIHLRLTWRHVA